jgi:hypothetical protein
LLNRSLDELRGSRPVLGARGGEVTHSPNLALPLGRSKQIKPHSGSLSSGANLAAPGSGALCEQTGVHKSFVKIDVIQIRLFWVTSPDPEAVLRGGPGVPISVSSRCFCTAE